PRAGRRRGSAPFGRDRALGAPRPAGGARGRRSLGARGRAGGAGARAAVLRSRPGPARMDARYERPGPGAQADRGRLVRAPRVRERVGLGGQGPMRPLLALLAVLPLARGLAAEEPVLWTLENGTVRVRPGAEPGPLAVGSLLKPFVAKAWAHAHPGVPPPVERCERASGCWRPAGHGSAGLTRALAVSCNAYFQKMAAETPA